MMKFVALSLSLQLVLLSALTQPNDFHVVSPFHAGDIAVDPRTYSLTVADMDAPRLLTFTSDGQLVHQMVLPYVASRIAISPVDGAVYCIEYDGAVAMWPIQISDGVTQYFGAGPFLQAYDIAVNSGGTVYIAYSDVYYDYAYIARFSAANVSLPYNNNNRINTGSHQSMRMTVDSAGSVFLICVSTYTATVFVLYADGTTDTFTSADGSIFAGDIAIDQSDLLYIATAGNTVDTYSRGGVRQSSVGTIEMSIYGLVVHADTISVTSWSVESIIQYTLPSGQQLPNISGPSPPPWRDVNAIVSYNDTMIILDYEVVWIMAMYNDTVLRTYHNASGSNYGYLSDVDVNRRNGDIFFTDTYHDRIIQITQNGQVTVISDGAYQLVYPTDIAVLDGGDLFVSIKSMTVLQYNHITGYFTDLAPITNPPLKSIPLVATDANGFLYLFDPSDRVSRVYKYGSDTSTPLVTYYGDPSVQTFAVDRRGRVYLSDQFDSEILFAFQSNGTSLCNVTFGWNGLYSAGFVQFNVDSTSNVLITGFGGDDDSMVIIYPLSSLLPQPRAPASSSSSSSTTVISSSSGSEKSSSSSLPSGSGGSGCSGDSSSSSSVGEIMSTAAAASSTAYVVAAGDYSEGFVLVIIIAVPFFCCCVIAAAIGAVILRRRSCDVVKCQQDDVLLPPLSEQHVIYYQQPPLPAANV